MKPIKKGMTEAVTRDGRKVTQLTWFDAEQEPYPVHGILDGCVFTWTIHGKNLRNDDSSCDIFAPVEYEWQWLAKDEDGRFMATVGHYKTKQDASISLNCLKHIWTVHSRIEESKREVLTD